MDTALHQKFPFILDRNLAEANCTGNRVCTSCDTVVLDAAIFYYNIVSLADWLWRLPHDGAGVPLVSHYPLPPPPQQTGQPGECTSLPLINPLVTDTLYLVPMYGKHFDLKKKKGLSKKFPMSVAPMSR